MKDGEGTQENNVTPHVGCLVTIAQIYNRCVDFVEKNLVQGQNGDGVKSGGRAGGWVSWVTVIVAPRVSGCHTTHGGPVGHPLSQPFFYLAKTFVSEYKPMPAPECLY